jgi:hypothetical protein
MVPGFPRAKDFNYILGSYCCVSVSLDDGLPTPELNSATESAPVEPYFERSSKPEREVRLHGSAFSARDS